MATLEMNDEFNEFEIDDELQDFLDFVKNKENEKIPEPSPYTISTQSAWCLIDDLNNIDLSKVVLMISDIIIKNLIFKNNSDCLIQGLVIENMILRFDDIYFKKYKRNYIKFFGNVIDPNNLEDCLFMHENIYLLQNKSLKKQGRQKNKKDNEHFYNSCSIIIKGGKDRKAVNVKLFNNGQITLTGAKEEIDGIEACNVLLNELKKNKEIFIDTSDEKIEKAKISNFRITMINSDFNTNFKIDLLKLLDILNNLEEERFIKFNPAIYRGLMIGFLWNSSNEIQDGICHCTNETKCNGKKKKKKDDKEKPLCKKITISIFKSGSVIITGGYLKEQIEDAYAFINHLFKEHFHDIKKLSILDFQNEDLNEEELK